MICNKKAYSDMKKECKKCSERVACFNGCAVGVGVLIPENAAAPLMRETIQINIGGVMRTVYKDDMEKEIYKAFQKPFMMNYGA